MGKYDYDRDLLKDISIKPFLNQVRTRNEAIEKAEDTMPPAEYNVNRLQQALHPPVQFARVAEVIQRPGARSYILQPDPMMGCLSLAYFRAGQYVSVMTGDSCRPYTICSSPKSALGTNATSYMLTVQENSRGKGSSYIFENWKAGTQVAMSGPLGNFYYEGLRDAKNVVAIAGGSGIAPFFSMAAAIADGIEDFRLTIICGARTTAGVFMRNELLEICARSKGKVKLVCVLSEEVRYDAEFGYVTADMIMKHAPKNEDYSVFVSGEKAMCKYLEAELKKLEKPARRIRFELQGEYGSPVRDTGFPKEKALSEYNVKVTARGEEYKLTCRADRSLLQAMESAGIMPPSDCRNGECGWCRSRLISGQVYVPNERDKRRMADEKFGWIHPCVSYPLSDIELEVFPILM